MKQQKTFVDKIRNTFIKNAIIPIFLLLILFSAFFIYNAMSDVQNRTKNLGKEIGEQLDQIHSNYKSETLKMAQDETVINYLLTNEKSNLIFEKYYKNKANQEAIFDFAILNDQREVVLDSDNQDLLALDKSLYKLLQMEESGKQELDLLYSKVKVDYGNIYFYGFGTVVYHEERAIGYIVYYTSDRLLKNLIMTEGVEDAVLVNSFDTVLNTTFESARNNFNKFSFEKEPDEFYIKDKKYYKSTYPLKEDGLKLITMNNLESEQSIFRVLPSFILVTMSGLIVVLLYLSKRMSRQATDPIKELLKVVRRTKEGDLHANINLHTGDEFEVLANEYNGMLRELNQLIDKNQELFERQKEAEMTILRNQFNPHFIFNVLETLRYTIMMDEKQAEKIVLSLSKFLRFNLYTKEQLLPLEEDFDNLQNYLELHQARFQERMKYSIEISEEAKTAMVPKFFIQPFAENSIKHGFKTRQHFSIWIDAKVENNHLKVTVRDNGKGMPEERFEEVKERLNDKTFVSNHIGMYNTNQILKLTYGEEYGIQLINKIGEGLTVVIVIPLQREGKDL